MKKFLNYTFILATGLCLYGCNAVFDKSVQWQAVKPTTFPVLTAIGQAPISLQMSTNETQRMLMAISASKIAAYAELAEQVYGQQVTGKLTMSNLVVNNQALEASVQGVIRGAKVIKSYPVGDTYTTELSLNFKDVYAIYETTNRQKEVKRVDYY
jgi:hypothetical protein